MYMMGKQHTQDELWTPALDLFARIPEDHVLRRLERVLDLSFVRTEVADCYGTNGNASVDPVVLMKMMLLLFLDDVPSERELMRIIPLRLDYLWFLGFGLNEAIPDHSVLKGIAAGRSLLGTIANAPTVAGIGISSRFGLSVRVGIISARISVL